MSCTTIITTPAFPDGSDGTPSGPAGGDLTGTYPDPDISPAAIHEKTEKATIDDDDEVLLWDSVTTELRRTKRSVLLSGFVSYTDQQAKDAVGGSLVSTPTITLTYDGGTRLITADLINDSVTSVHLKAGAVTAPAITDRAVTFNKVETVPTNRLLGRSTPGAGSMEPIMIGTGLLLTGGTLTATFVYTDSQAKDAVGGSLVSTPTITLTYDGGTRLITADLANGSVTSVHLGAGAVTNPAITDRAVTFNKIETVPTNRLLGRSTAGAGSMEPITVGTGLLLTGGTLTATFVYTDSQAKDAVGGSLLPSTTVTLTYDAIARTITAAVINGSIGNAQLANKAVTFAKVQDIGTGKLLGRSTAGTGPPEEITIGTNLTLTGGTLSATGGTSWQILAPVITSAISISPSTTNYFGPFKVDNDASENIQKFIVQRPITVRRLMVRMVGGISPAGGALIFTVRKNGVDTAVQVMIAASSPAGVYVDLVNTVSFAINDEFSISATNTSASPSQSMSSLSVIAEG